MAEEDPAVVDTMVFSAAGVKGRTDLRSLYRPHLEGRRVVLSFHAVAEPRFCALHGGWSAAGRREPEWRIASVTVAGFDDRLTTTYAELRHELVRAGHGLGQKVHDGDRWIAATALHGLPLVTHDRIFLSVPRLEVVTELSV